MHWESAHLPKPERRCAALRRVPVCHPRQSCYGEASQDAGRIWRGSVNEAGSVGGRVRTQKGMVAVLKRSTIAGYMSWFGCERERDRLGKFRVASRMRVTGRH